MGTKTPRLGLGQQVRVRVRVRFGRGLGLRLGLGASLGAVVIVWHLGMPVSPNWDRSRITQIPKAVEL